MRSLERRRSFLGCAYSAPLGRYGRECCCVEPVIDAELLHAGVLAPNFDEPTDGLQFKDVLAAMVEMMTHPGRVGPVGCLLVKMHLSPERLGPAARARVTTLRERARDSYVALVDQAKLRGEIPSTVSTTVAAALIDIQSTSLMVQMALGEEDPELLRAQALLGFEGLTNVDNVERGAS